MISVLLNSCNIYNNSLCVFLISFLYFTLGFCCFFFARSIQDFTICIPNGHHMLEKKYINIYIILSVFADIQSVLQLQFSLHLKYV